MPNPENGAVMPEELVGPPVKSKLTAGPEPLSPTPPIPSTKSTPSVASQLGGFVGTVGAISGEIKGQIEGITSDINSKLGLETPPAPNQGNKSAEQKPQPPAESNVVYNIDPAKIVAEVAVPGLGLAIGIKAVLDRLAAAKIDSKKGLSRRQFLKWSAVATGSAALASCSVKEPNPSPPPTPDNPPPTPQVGPTPDVQRFAVAYTNSGAVVPVTPELEQTYNAYAAKTESQFTEQARKNFPRTYQTLATQILIVDETNPQNILGSRMIIADFDVRKIGNPTDPAIIEQLQNFFVDMGEGKALLQLPDSTIPLLVWDPAKPGEFRQVPRPAETMTLETITYDTVNNRIWYEYYDNKANRVRKYVDLNASTLQIAELQPTPAPSATATPETRVPKFEITQNLVSTTRDLSDTTLSHYYAGTNSDFVLEDNSNGSFTYTGWINGPPGGSKGDNKAFRPYISIGKSLPGMENGFIPGDWGGSFIFRVKSGHLPFSTTWDNTEVNLFNPFDVGGDNPHPAWFLNLEKGSRDIKTGKTGFVFALYETITDSRGIQGHRLLEKSKVQMYDDEDHKVDILQIQDDLNKPPRTIITIDGNFDPDLSKSLPNLVRHGISEFTHVGIYAPGGYPATKDNPLEVQMRDIKFYRVKLTPN